MEVQAGVKTDSEVRIVRGWKLFMALSRMLLRRPGLEVSSLRAS